ncbi:NUDIX hydrolase [Metabacillus idriensis]|uniref:NUDIX hydrolase n=1 Tax=Metabacillus idriensis TaxID=324768 RepID=UPI003D290FAA
MNDYVKTMRKFIGQETLLTVGCGAIIEDEQGRILLQQRTDYGIWGIPGGLLELGETFEEAVLREVLEETGLSLNKLELFGIYSGVKGFSKYSNGDQVFSVQIIFHTTDYTGILTTNNESKEISFLHQNELPENINPHQSPFILDWVNGVQAPIIK